jgi:non-ribosomal peptide synthetase component F
MFASFRAPPPLRGDHGSDGDVILAASYVHQMVALPEATTASLHAWARQRQITLNTLMQGAWAMVLSQCSGANDVVFGVTHISRPAALNGVDAMVGLLMNSLPMRVQLPPSLSVLSWLRQIQDQQVEMRQYDYSPLALVREWSGVPAEQPLFESNLRFQNLTLDATLLERLGSLEIKEEDRVDIWHYPLNIVISPNAALTIAILYDSHRFDSGMISCILEQFQQFLQELVAEQDRSLAAIQACISA